MSRRSLDRTGWFWVPVGLGLPIGTGLVGGCDSSMVIGELAPPGGDQGAAAGSPAPGSDDGGSAGTAPVVAEWSADHETGDLSQWRAGGDDAGGYFDMLNASKELSTDYARSGNYSVRLTVEPASETAHSKLYRHHLPAEAYYSIWYYLPRVYEVPDWWGLMAFGGAVDDDPGDLVSGLSLNVYSPSEGTLTFYVWDHILSQHIDMAVPTEVPVGRWFQVEAFFRNAVDETGRITFWLDGEPVLDLQDIRTSAEGTYLRWTVGSWGQEATPLPVVLYLDDAAVSATRIGP